MGFALVIFEENNELSVVPVKWLKGNSCVWPNCRSKDVTKYVLSEATPDSDWKLHEVKILSIYDTYADARRHEKKAEDMDTSNVDTDPERLGRGHRQKRFRERRYSSSSSDEERPTKRLEFPPVPELTESGEIRYVTEINEIPVDKYDVIAENGTSDANSEKIKLGNKSISGPSGFSESPIEPPQQSRLLRDVLHMKMTLREHGEVLQSILQALNALVDRSAVQTNVSLTESLPMSLPLRTYEEVTCLEEQLDDGDVKEYLCTLIAQVGGLNLGNSIRRMMAKLMTNEVGMLFSWLGAKEKLPFVNLKLRKIIFDAVRRKKLYEDVQDSDIETIIKDWLRHAKARSKNKENSSS